MFGKLLGVQVRTDDPITLGRRFRRAADIQVDETRVDREQLERCGPSLAVAVGLAARVVAA